MNISQMNVMLEKTDVVRNILRTVRRIDGGVGEGEGWQTGFVQLTEKQVLLIILFAPPTLQFLKLWITAPVLMKQRKLCENVCIFNAYISSVHIIKSTL